MEEKKFDIIKAGTRVHEKDKPEHVGTVVMQAETTGRCLVKLDEYSSNAHTAGGLFKEPRAIWLGAGALVVEEEPAPEFVPDIRKNWAVSLHCVDGKISYVMRYESGRFAHGWLRKENLTPAEAAREWAEGKEAEPEYKQICGETDPEKEEKKKMGYPDDEGRGVLHELLETLKNLAEE